MQTTLPRRIVVKEVLESRYAPGERPVSWDKRTPGIELILTTEGERIPLYSSGGQSSPNTGWELLLMRPIATQEGGEESAASWTLYGIRKPHFDAAQPLPEEQRP